MYSLGLIAGMAGFAIKAAIVDHRSGRLPNRLTGAVWCLAVGLVAGWIHLDPGPIVAAAAVWLLVAALHFALVVLPPYGMGAGDLKLVAGLLMPLAWWGSWWIWLLLAYGSAALAALRGRSLHRLATSVRMGPWLVTAWLAVVVGQLTHVALAYRW